MNSQDNDKLDSEYPNQSEIQMAINGGLYGYATELLKDTYALKKRIKLGQAVDLAEIYSNQGKVLKSNELLEIVQKINSDNYSIYEKSAQIAAKNELNLTNNKRRALNVYNSWIDKWENGSKIRDITTLPLECRQEIYFTRLEYTDLFYERNKLYWSVLELGINPKNLYTLKLYRDASKSLIEDARSSKDFNEAIRVKEHLIKTFGELVLPIDFFDLAKLYTEANPKDVVKKVTDALSKIKIEELEKNDPTLAERIMAFKNSFMEKQKLTPSEFMKLYFKAEETLKPAVIDVNAKDDGTRGGPTKPTPPPGPQVNFYSNEEKLRFYLEDFCKGSVKTQAQGDENMIFANYFALGFRGKGANLRVYEVFIDESKKRRRRKNNPVKEVKDKAYGNAVYVTPIDFVPDMTGSLGDGTPITTKRMLRDVFKDCGPVAILYHSANFKKNMLELERFVKEKGDAEKGIIAFNEARMNKRVQSARTQKNKALATVEQTTELEDKIEELHILMRQRRNLEEAIYEIEESMSKEENSQDKQLKKDLKAGKDLRKENTEAISKLTGRDKRGISRRLNGKFNGRGEE